jgi:hypothetical protein
LSRVLPSFSLFPRLIRSFFPPMPPTPATAWEKRFSCSIAPRPVSPLSIVPTPFTLHRPPSPRPGIASFYP